MWESVESYPACFLSSSWSRPAAAAGHPGSLSWLSPRAGGLVPTAVPHSTPSLHYIIFVTHLGDTRHFHDNPSAEDILCPVPESPAALFSGQCCDEPSPLLRPCCQFLSDAERRCQACPWVSGMPGRNGSCYCRLPGTPTSRACPVPVLASPVLCSWPALVKRREQEIAQGPGCCLLALGPWRSILQDLGPNLTWLSCPFIL